MVLHLILIFLIKYTFLRRMHLILISRYGRFNSNNEWKLKMNFAEIKKGAWKVFFFLLKHKFLRKISENSSFSFLSRPRMSGKSIKFFWLKSKLLTAQIWKRKCFMVRKFGTLTLWEIWFEKLNYTFCILKPIPRLLYLCITTTLVL
jgi:hypothetical protein